MLLKPAPDGTGVIAGGAVRAVITACGIPNVLTKSIGRRNPHNVVKATIVALESLRDKNAVAEMRGLAVEKLLMAGRHDQNQTGPQPDLHAGKAQAGGEGSGAAQAEPDCGAARIRPVFRGMVKKVPHLLQVVE